VVSFFVFTWIMPSAGGVATCVEINQCVGCIVTPSSRYHEDGVEVDTNAP